jgi:hypothetical protein
MKPTQGDHGGLFLQPPGAGVDEQSETAVDDSEEAMHRLRFPFEANPADVFEQRLAVEMDEDEYRG